jgi:hypothetical protein
MYEIFSSFKSKEFFQIRKASEVLNKKIFLRAKLFFLPNIMTGAKFIYSALFDFVAKFHEKFSTIFPL